MTRTEFISRKAWGQIHPTTQVRTIIWKFPTSENEWEEIFVDRRYQTIAQQEQSFRDALEFAGAVVISPFEPTATVQAQHWKA